MSLSAKTFQVHKGDVLDVTLSSPVANGQPGMVGDLFGVYRNDGEAGSTVAFVVSGAFDLPKVAGAVGQGEKLYFIVATSQLTTDDDDGENPFAGHAALPAGAGDAAVRCLLR